MAHFESDIGKGRTMPLWTPADQVKLCSAVLRRIFSENVLKGLSVGTVRKCAVVEGNQKLGVLDRQCGLLRIGKTMVPDHLRLRGRTGLPLGLTRRMHSVAGLDHQLTACALSSR
jgi:hypothetical protein